MQTAAQQYANPTPPIVIDDTIRPTLASALERAGIGVSRYGLVAILLLIGGLKFTHAEAQGIQPLVSHSPLMSWMYSVLSVQAVSNLIGVIEIGVAFLMALRRISPRASFVGSVGAMITFLITLSFLITTPGAFEPGYWYPRLGGAGQFLIKDLALLGASIWTAAEALTRLKTKKL
jgi:uncharacterized membrane protein YkgB